MSQMMTFIGGPADGQTHKVRDGVDVVYVDEVPPPTVKMSHMNRLPYNDVLITKHIYRREGNVLRYCE